MAEQEAPELPFRLLRAPLGEGCLGLRKLITGTACRVWICGQHPLRASRIAQGQQHIGLQLRRLGIEDAVRIAVRKAAQQSLGCGFVARRVVSLGAQKIRVVGQLLASLPGLAQARFRLGIALVHQICVAAAAASPAC